MRALSFPHAPARPLVLVLGSLVLACGGGTEEVVGIASPDIPTVLDGISGLGDAPTASDAVPRAADAGGLGPDLTASKDTGLSDAVASDVGPGDILQPSDGAGDTQDAAVEPPETAIGEVTPDGEGQEVVWDDTWPDGGAQVDFSQVDISQDDISEEDAPNKPCDPTTAAPGECAATCHDDAECTTEPCVSSRGGTVCGGACSLCPADWVCASIPSLSDSVCMPQTAVLGKPCVLNADCLAPLPAGADIGAKCIEYEGLGSFCGAACKTGAECPGGFECLFATSVGALVQQCKAADSGILCTPYFASLGSKTDCSAKGEFGACKGTLGCVEAGLGVCDAPSAAIEVCDGLDNDCDGFTDDGVTGQPCEVTNAFGACQGISTCTDGAPGCIGATPEAEVCDGTDNDCDGVTDGGLDGQPCDVTNEFGTCTGLASCQGGKLGCTAATPAAEICDGKDSDCDGATDEGCDDDGDGYCDVAIVYGASALCAKGPGDCNDTDPLMNPGAAEVCNSKDDNCNGAVDAADAALASGDVQACENQKGVCAGTTKPAPLCLAGSWKACDDAVYKGAAPTYGPKESVCDGKDDNCNGVTDEGCDDDGDGYCDAKMLFVTASACANGAGDCADDDKAVFPKASELCNGKDDNCDGATDAADLTLASSDGQPCEIQLGVCKDALKPPTLCVDGSWLACDATVYAAHAKAFSDGAESTCDDLDNDCNAKTDEACDQDGDGYCRADWKTTGLPAACPKGGGDCEDDDKAISPGATEVCNDVDDSCNGSTDEGCDDDGDGFCDAAMGAIGVPAACPKGAGDCDDAKSQVHPGADETCDALDDDCDGQTDEGFSGLGAPCTVGTGTCQASGTMVCSKKGDAVVCSSVPGGAGDEVCDDLDNNCDGQTDEACDGDTDGFCDANMVVVGSPKACPKGGGDCLDSNAEVHPGAVEICNALDDNCDGKLDAADPGLNLGGALCEAHKGVCAGLKKAASTCVNGEVKACTAAQYGVIPTYEAVEATCDGADNNCDGAVDEGCDADGDGYCDAKRTVTGTPGACPLGGGDCVDSDAGVHPSAPELCNGKDDDCDGNVDIADNALDLQGALCENQNGVCGGLKKPVSLCVGGAIQPCGAAQYKGVPAYEDFEITCDELDNNCDGTPDEGCDDDGDGYCDVDFTVVGAPSVCAEGAGDCDDLHAAAHPEGTEVCDGLDNDCNGKVDTADPAMGGNDQPLCDKQGGVCAGLKKPLSLCVGGSWQTCGDALYLAYASQYQAKELSCDDIDNDCNGATDNGCDDDADGFCDTTMAFVGPAVATCPNGPGDCDDGKGLVNPDGKEVCNGIDDDCDYKIDAKDMDLALYDKQKCEKQDGLCAGAMKPVTQCVGGNWQACADADYANFAPGYEATEKTCDNIDNSCNGAVDEGCDDDSDGFCDSGMNIVGTPKVCAAGPGDCDDKDAKVNPIAAEICGNLADDNCDGKTDDGTGDDLELGNVGWTLNTGWSVGAWCKYGGKNALCYGNGGSNYPGTAQFFARKKFTVPAGAKTLTFDFRYSPDPGEYGSYDQFGVSVGGTQILFRNAGTKGNTNWQPLTWAVPASMQGQVVEFATWFYTMDSVLNNGWGAGIDNITFSCN